MRNLKKRQLEELGVETGGEMEEIFFRYCLGEQFTDAEDIQSFCAFLKIVLDANTSIHCYDAGVLCSTFKTLASNLAIRLNHEQAGQLCRSSCLISRWGLWVHRLKCYIRG
jgi:hypothetical protein